MSNTLTQARVRELLDYDPATGILTWRQRSGFPQFNGRWAGKEAGYISSSGYRLINMDGHMEYAHRLIWLLQFGYMPDEVDHQNHKRSENWLYNLRDATKTENSKNRILQSNNTSGHVGVHYYKRTGAWTAYIHVDGKRKHLGYFKSERGAASARLSASNDNGYHENHGQKAA